MKHWNIVGYLCVLWLLSIGECEVDGTWVISLCCQVNSTVTVSNTTQEVALKNAWCSTNFTRIFYNYFHNNSLDEELFAKNLTIIEVDNYLQLYYSIVPCSATANQTTAKNPQLATKLKMEWVVNSSEGEENIKTRIKEGLTNKGASTLSTKIKAQLLGYGADEADIQGISTQLNVTSLNMSVVTTTVTTKIKKSSNSKFYIKYLYYIPLVFVPIFCCVISLIVWQRLRQKKQQMETMKPDQWLSDVSEMTTVDGVMKPVVHDVPLRVKSKKETSSVSMAATKPQNSKSLAREPRAQSEAPKSNSKTKDKAPSAVRNSELEGNHRQMSNSTKNGNNSGNTRKGDDDDDEEDNLDGGESARQKSKSFPGKVIPKSAHENNNQVRKTAHQSSVAQSKSAQKKAPSLPAKGETNNTADDDVMDEMLHETPGETASGPQVEFNQLRGQRGHTLAENERDVDVDDLYDS